MNLDRLEALIGKSKLEKIKNLNILIVGIGGVGGYTLESLVRSGIKNITIVDYDNIDETNLNRQILANLNNIGKSKVVEAKKRYESINKEINIKTINKKFDIELLKEIDISKYDYIIDTCDDIDAKVLLINEAINKNIKIVSSMGTAKKLDASKLSITTLDKTNYDKIAKILRKQIDKKIQKKVVVISSNEEVKNIDTLGSTSYLPGIAGLLITNYIIQNEINTSF